MNLSQISMVMVVAALLSACGGGGGSSSEAISPSVTVPPVVTPPVVTPPSVELPVTTPPIVEPPVVVPPAPYTLTPATLRASSVVGYARTIILNAKQTVAFTGAVYIKATSDSTVFDPNISVVPLSDVTADVQVKTALSAKPGHYAGNIIINVCYDVLCAKQLAGSPFNLPYDIDVVPPEGGVTAMNLSELSPLAGAADWETFQGNAQHTGYVPVTLIPSNFNARWKWMAAAYEGSSLHPSTLVTGDDMIFLSTKTYSIYQNPSFVAAYSEKDGREIWRFPLNNTDGTSVQPPAFNKSTIYISAGSQNMTAMFGLDAGSGRQIFKSKMDSQYDSYLAPTIFGGSIYTNGGHYGGLYSFNPSMGALNFFTSLPQNDGWTPAVDEKNLYVYVGGSLKLIDPVTGTLRSEINVPNETWSGRSVGGAPVIGANGMVLVSNLTPYTKNWIVALDVIKKSPRWSAKGSYLGNSAYADGIIFAANSETLMLEARKETDGTLLWSWTAPSGNQEFISDVLLTKNLVFISTDTTTYAIDRLTHAQVWSYNASGKLAISANGILYIKGDIAIVAINLKK
ncbi:outer membrane protein assembly factor BamB family protein [Janthinobacterium sp. BJB426]|uniref:outer membrane protein assembly factor BamB family protein n=1 Tax=Janthinobacterium sp. BJB426 TaxID=2048010 RepID=UPI0013052978|nr:PQQ-binding-like beta-propeller repeat protein [Janthinobacterium sp. BJB426]